MSIAALLRRPAKPIPGQKAVGDLGNSIWMLINRFIRTSRDERALQMLPDNVLADMGLEKMEIMAGTSGQRHVWVIPHRYC